MASMKITEGIYSVGVLNPNLRVFDIVMTTDFGTSYNSYIVKGSEKIALLETCHKTYFKHFLAHINEVCDPSEIDYIILNHNEPDHSGSLAQLMELMPNAQIVASQAGSLYLKNITNNPQLNVKVAKDGDTLDLGGKTLKFINAPFLHWPDSMFTWLEEDKTLFSCDFMGSHYCEPFLFDYNITHPAEYENAFLGYYNAIFGPFKPYVLAGLSKIEQLPIEFVCSSHGPVITKEGRLDYIKKCYAEWSQPHKNEQPTIPVFYTSAYGNTRQLAEKIAQGILETVPGAKVGVYNVIDYPISEMRAALESSDAFAIGSPTINRDAVPPMWELLSHVDVINNQKKPVLAFGSYGWSGEGVPNMIARLNSLKMAVYGDGLKVTFVPNESDLEKARELGKSFGETIKK